MTGPCFWDQFKQDQYIFCEKQVCGLISEPANTWSNIGYLVVAIMIFRSVQDRRIKNYFFWSSLLLFFGSSAFHATSTYWGKFFDVSAMFLLSMSILSLSLQRYFTLSNRQTDLAYFTGVTVSIVFLYFMGYGLILFAAQIIYIAWLEIKIANTPKGLDYKLLKQAIMTFIIAFAIWIGDVTKVLCDPDNHILSGHAVWHLLCAVVIWLVYRSIPVPPSSPSLSHSVPPA